ncbi:hypothetical protein [Marinobacter shengliensis]|uniref:Uncharacterized protein n=1 Tax=Marinobacter shengliensis TaxID=1389223 RepID=A0ABV4W731_9GAMM
MEKQLASLKHLFPAKNPTATPRRRALAGSRENFLGMCCLPTDEQLWYRLLFACGAFLGTVALWGFVGFAGWMNFYF